MRSADETARVADRLNAAVVSGDEAFQREVFSDDIRIWHNTDEQELDLEAAIKSIASVRGKCASVEHTDVRRTPTPEGYVQESVIRIRTHAGAEFASPTCIVVEVDGDGRIGSVREYTDSARLAPMFDEA
jgi:ketosteroid isomerase-like protein